MIRQSLLLTGGRTTTAVLRFARNIFLARLLSVEDYGIASTFMVAIAFVEMASALGLERLIVQNKDGDEPRFVGSIQTLNLLRGLLMSGLVFALAGEIAELFGNASLAWAYQAFAIVPVLRSIAHLDMMREQRHMRFRAQTFSELGAIIVSLILLYPVFLWLGDFRVLLVLIVIDMIVRAALSFYYAERKFKLSWDPAIFRTAMKFGWPLLVSGLLSFLILQGDRIIVAKEFTARDLGIFSAALTLGMTPTLLVASICQSFFLPFLSKVQNEPERFERRVTVAMQSYLWFSTIAMLLFTSIGPFVFVALFGEKYAEGSAMCALIGGAFSLRLLRGGATTVAVSKGYTVNLMLANIPRLLSLVAAFIAVSRFDGGISTVLIISIIGEFAAYVVALSLLRFKLGVGTKWMLVPFLLGGIVFALCINTVFVDTTLISTAVAAITILALIFVSRHAREGITKVAARK